MRYMNPIIRGFNPDPSVCRAGEDYYLVTSSFEYFPALPIYHSRDLVNWTLIGNCQTFGNSLDLTRVRENGGIWAPTIRYHGGMFYMAIVVESAPRQYSNYVICAQNPTGPWSDPVKVDIRGIDPSLFFEDGKAYFCTNDRLGSDSEGICLGVIDPISGETLEPFRRIWSGTGGGWLEAPHLYHIGDWYYLMCAEGGTSYGHMEVVARSKSPWGPYDACPYNPILTNRNDAERVACCCGHGDLLEDGNGNWWMAHLGVRYGFSGQQSQLGRETFLTPVSWSDGWPVIASSRARLDEEGPVMAEQRPWEGFTDDFSGESWPPRWCFVRNPSPERYKRGNGELRVLPSGKKPGEQAFDGLVCMKQPDLDFEMDAEVSLAALGEGIATGLMVMVNHGIYCFFGVRPAKGGYELFLERKTDDLDVISYTEAVAPGGGGLKLRISGTADEYVFALMRNGAAEEKCRASAHFFSNSFTGRGFTGAMIGLYAEADGTTAKPAAFRDFALRNPRA